MEQISPADRIMTNVAPNVGGELSVTRGTQATVGQTPVRGVAKGLLY